MTQNANTIPPSIGVTLGAMTDVGLKRSANQDSMCSIAAPNTPSGAIALVAVADGMGGHQGGEVASAIAIEGVVAYLGKKNGPAVATGDRSQLLTGAIHQIHADVRAASNTPETTGMGTTLSIAIIDANRMWVGHVGDSRIYRVRGGGNWPS